MRRPSAGAAPASHASFVRADFVAAYASCVQKVDCDVRDPRWFCASEWRKSRGEPEDEPACMRFVSPHGMSVPPLAVECFFVTAAYTPAARTRTLDCLDRTPWADLDSAAFESRLDHRLHGVHAQR